MKKICKDQLVAKLVPLFRDTDDTDIDEAIKQAKNQLIAKTKDTKREDLNKLFDSQMQTLKFRGCPQAILKEFQKKKSEVLNKVIDMEIPKEHIPFIPVIPRSYLGVYGLIAMVNNNEKGGYTYLNPNEITDNIETPKDPYFIYDVEEGKEILGESVKNAEKLIKKQNRFCLIVDEGIAVCVHTNVLSKHYVCCTGSRCRHAGGVLVVCLDDEPSLNWLGLDYLDVRWGTASCCSRSD